MTRKPNIKKAYKNYHSSSGQGFHEKRELLHKAVKSLGIDGSLEALDLSRDRNATWYNVHTGSEESLESLITENIIGHVPEDNQLDKFFYTLEHWKPKTEDPNPVIAESLTLSEEDVRYLLVAGPLKKNLSRAKTSEEFVCDVGRQGGTLEHGSYTGRPGKVSVTLHDGREMVFSSAKIYAMVRREEEQPSLFASLQHA